MTETLIVKYSFILYSFKFLTLSLPKFRDIKNNIIQHYWWMRFPRKLWMYSMILEVKFAYVVVFVYACLFTSWRQNTFLTNESSAAPSVYFRQNVRSAKRPSAKCPFGKMSFGKMSFGKVSFGKMSVYRILQTRRIFLFTGKIFIYTRF
jgi:hypothetical protein